MVEKRVRDGSVLRLIQKWIKVGVIEDGKLLMSETGTGQGSRLVAPGQYLPASRTRCVVRGSGEAPSEREAYEIRFADDAILCFQYREDAEKVMRVLPKRLRNTV